MALVSDHVERAGRSVTVAEITAALPADRHKPRHVLSAIDALVDEGHLGWLYHRPGARIRSRRVALIEAFIDDESLDDLAPSTHEGA